MKAWQPKLIVWTFLCWLLWLRLCHLSPALLTTCCVDFITVGHLYLMSWWGHYVCRCGIHNAPRSEDTCVIQLDFDLMHLYKSIVSCYGCLSCGCGEVCQHWCHRRGWGARDMMTIASTTVSVDSWKGSLLYYLLCGEGPAWLSPDACQNDLTDSAVLRICTLRSNCLFPLDAMTITWWDATSWVLDLDWCVYEATCRDW